MTQGFQLRAQAPAAYERYLVPVLFAPCAERLLDLVAVEPGDRVLDVVYAAFAKALRRHAGTETAALMHAPFAGPSRDELRRLLTDAGFDKVVVRIAAFPARFPSPGEFLRRQAASSPLGPPLAALDEEARQALARDLDQTLGEWTDDDGLVCPMETWLATARR
jgi:hypothetical protein